MSQIGNALPFSARDDAARLHFTVLDPQQQEQAIRRMAACGHGPHTLAVATGLSVEQIRRVLRDQEAAA